jgi:hypothetical protein
MVAAWILDTQSFLVPKICRVEGSRIDPLPCDKWLASSALQKCIRRGHADLAVRAAVRFGELDPAGLWRRLINIAFEDIGAGDPKALIETVAVATSPAWRSEHGERRVISWIVRQLADAPKDRGADLLMLAVRYHESLTSLRQSCSQLSLQERLEHVVAPSASLSEHAVAAWFCSGLDFRYERIVGRGNLDGLGEAYRALGLDHDLIDATILAARRTRESLIIIAPLVLLEINRTGGATISDAPIPDTPIIEGLPLSAIDQYTRPGKQAINRLVAQDGRLRACLERFVPKSRWVSAAQHAAFYVDGAPIARRIEWAHSKSLEVLGMEADVGSAAVPREGVQPLVDAVAASLDHLNEIRREIWRSLRATGQSTE